MILKGASGGVQSTSSGQTERQREIYETREVQKRTWKARNELVKDAKLRPALKHVVAVLWDFIGMNDECWPSLPTLAERCGYGPNSLSALHKKLRELSKLGIITMTRRYEGGTQRSRKYKIVFDRLATFCDAPVPLPEPLSSDPKTVSIRMQYEPVHPCPDRREDRVPTDRDITSKQTGITTSKNNQRITTEPPMNAGGEILWDQAAAVISDFGVDCVKDKIELAQSRGLSPSEVLELVEIAKSAGQVLHERISPGLLCHRIKTHRPGQDLRSRWHPEAQVAIDRIGNQVSRRTNTEQDGAEAQAAIEKKAAEKAMLKILEQKHGGTIDGMDPDSYAELVEKAFICPNSKRIAKNKKAPFTRPTLLRWIDRNSPFP